MDTTEARAIAQARLEALVATLRQPGSEVTSQLLEECDALKRAIEAFHLEAIRFRMFNVDRMLARSQAPVASRDLFEEIRMALEAAGFHTRSH